MSPNGISCELVDEGNLDTRYLAGALTDPEAEAFEAHFFGCERCWGLVQQGLAVQAAYESATPQAARPATQPVTSSDSSARPRAGLRTRLWWGLAAAAVLVLAVVGIRRLVPGAARAGSDDVLRGGIETFVVSPGATRTSVTAAWPSVPDADIYQVRLYAADGTLVTEREVADTAISMVGDSLLLPPGREAFWEVQALDGLRNPIARSELTRAVLPRSAP